MENNTHRALQAIENSKRAIWTSIEELSEERSRARGDRRRNLSDQIDALLVQLNQHRKIEIQTLDNDDQIRDAIETINLAAGELESEARQVNDVAKAIVKKKR